MRNARKKAAVVLLVGILVLMAAAGCGSRGGGARSSSPLPADESSGEGDVSGPEQEEAGSGHAARNGKRSKPGTPVTGVTEPCPICGQEGPAGDRGRPLAVMIDNHPRARPQSGLDRACLVYEVLVEGGLTRFLAVFHHQDADLLGPVRSARDYFMEIAETLDAVYVHVGGSPQAKERIDRGGVIRLDDMRGDEGFWRVEFRYPPYNLYASTVKLRAAAARRGYDTSWDATRVPFTVGSEGFRGERATRVSVRYPGAAAEVVSYRYEGLTGTYLRFTGGEAHTDGGSGQQLQAASVVVQFVPTKPIPLDEEGRLDMQLSGEGDALLFTRGSVVRGRWQRPPGGKWGFRTEAGAPFRVLPGQTWVQVVPTGTRVEWQ